MIGIADFDEALKNAWQNSGLDGVFKALWPADAVADRFMVLNEEEASPGQPWPYCVWGRSKSSTKSRMSGAEPAYLQEIRDVPVEFHVHAQEIAGDMRSSKEIAAYLAEEVMKVFGGHPVDHPTMDTEMRNGNLLICEYQNDVGVKPMGVGSENVYEWIVYFVFRIDVPVAV